MNVTGGIGGPSVQQLATASDNRSATTTPQLSLLTLDIPQANSLERVITYVQQLHAGHVPNAKSLGIDPRQVDYYRHAAEVLGFVRRTKRQREVTAAGRALLSLSPALRFSRLAIAFADSTCGKAWAAWYRAPSLVEVPAATAHQFLLQATRLRRSMVKRRSATLKLWWQKLSPEHPAIRRVDIPARRLPRRLALGQTAVLDRARGREVVAALGPGSHHLRVASAYLSLSGFELLQASLEQADLRLLVGSEQAVQSLDAIYQQFVASIQAGGPSPVKRAAILATYTHLLSGRIKIRWCEPRFLPQVHAKLYLFDETAAYVTSSNLSRSGLVSNIESGYTVRDAEAIRYYRAQFDELFEKATPVWPVPPLEESWVFQPNLIQPYLLYLRVLLELFPRVPTLTRPVGYQLATYQEHIVSVVLRALKDRRGALLVSPTGTGKTIMASYVAALLKEQDIRRVIMVCPNQRLQRYWEEKLDEFGVAAKFITHGRVQGKGRSKNKRALPGKSWRVPHINETDLIITDEVHAFRGRRSTGHKELASFFGDRRSPQAPKVLLLSATPLSKGPEDLNNLLVGLLGEERLPELAAVADAQAVVNMSLPFIIKHFGEAVGDGPATGLRMGSGLRYFARMTVTTIKYRSPMEAVFRHIAAMDFQFRLRPNGATRKARKAGERREDSIIPDGLLKLALLRRAESSPQALRDSLDRLLRGESSLEPLDPVAFRSSLQTLRQRCCTTPDDDKLHELLRFLRSLPKDRKVLLFSLWRSTVQYLAEALRAQLPEHRMAALTGQTSLKERTALLRRFAPVAQGRTRRLRRDDIDLLIATDAIAEGENLEDAEVVINYDLPWTPLLLIQRIGRVDRPTPTQRDVLVCNFYPGSKQFTRLVSLYRRLGERAEFYAKLSRIQVFGEEERDFAELDERNLGLVRAFYEHGNLDQLRSEYLPTSTCLIDRAAAKEVDLAAAARLPLGAQSAMLGPRAGTFMLLRVGEQLHSVFQDVEGLIEEAPHAVSHEQVLRLIRVERGASAQAVPHDFEATLDALLNRWCQQHGVEREAVTVVCAEGVSVPSRHAAT